jgi:hypothetical protein
MDSKDLDNLHQAQRERLCFIDFRLMFLGDVGRVDLSTKFDVAPAVFTRDVALYREYAPENCSLNNKLKRYEVGSKFKPMFTHDVHRVLSALSRGYGEGLNQASTGYLTAEFPLHLNQPDVNVLAIVSRAIYQKKLVRVTYHSFSSGQSKRDLAPFAIVDSGARWHIRAFDRRSQTFRDFAINRISKPSIVDDPVQPVEQPEHDHQWLRMLHIELAPHPSIKNPEVVEVDYGMKDGKLMLNLRAAVAGYVLQAWNVDCSEDHHLDPVRYRLSLKDADKVLHQVESAAIAPGFADTQLAT